MRSLHHGRNPGAKASPPPSRLNLSEIIFVHMRKPSLGTGFLVRLSGLGPSPACQISSPRKRFVPKACESAKIGGGGGVGGWGGWGGEMEWNGPFSCWLPSAPKNTEAMLSLFLRKHCISVYIHRLPIGSIALGARFLAKGTATLFGARFSRETKSTTRKPPSSFWTP